MRGKHRQRRGRPQLGLRPRVFAWVDLRTSVTHYLTPEAAAAGRRGGGRYIALCGAEVLTAGMTDPGRGTCPSCSSTTQRTGAR